MRYCLSVQGPSRETVNFLDRIFGRLMLSCTKLWSVWCIFSEGRAAIGPHCFGCPFPASHLKGAGLRHSGRYLRLNSRAARGNPQDTEAIMANLLIPNESNLSLIWKRCSAEYFEIMRRQNIRYWGGGRTRPRKTRAWSVQRVRPKPSRSKKK